MKEYLEKLNRDDYIKHIVNEKLPAFKAELKALLQKYGAVIGGAYEGDGHGIYNEQFTVAFYCAQRECDRQRLFSDEIVINCENMHVWADDIDI